MRRESAELQRSFEATMQAQKIYASPEDLEGSVGILLGFWADRS